MLGIPVQQCPVGLDGLLLLVQLAQILGAKLHHGQAVEVVLGNRLEVVQGSLVIALLGNYGVLVHDGLGVLVVGLGGRRLQRLLVRGQDFLGLDQLPRQVVRHGQGGPVLTDLRASLQHGGPALDVALVVAHLDLKEGEIALNLNRLGLELQSGLVGLDSLLKVLLVAVKQAVNMPADVRLHVGHQGLLAQRKGLVRVALLIDDQCLHGHGVAMFGVLLEDLLGRLQAALVLFILIVADDLAEERVLFRAERLRHARRGRRGVVVGATLGNWLVNGSLRC